MFKALIRTVCFTIAYLFRPRGDLAVSVDDLPPDASPEDINAAVDLAIALAKTPTATDDYRDPPPPWMHHEEVAP